MLVRLDSRAFTDSPLLGTDSDKVNGQSDTFLIAGSDTGSVFDSCAGMILLTANVGKSSAVKICNEV